MARRYRGTFTIREDDGKTSGRRGRKKQSSVLVIIILVLLGLFLLSRTQRPAGLPAQPSAIRR